MKEKILVIDHEKDNRTILENVLKKEGYRVTGASDGRKAMDLIKSEPFDLIIIDTRTPNIKGSEAVSQMKMLDSSLEVIVFTGHATIENAVNSLRNNGAFDFLSKPLQNTDELTKTVRVALQKHKLNKEKRFLFHRVKEITEELKGILSRLSGYESK